MSNNRKLKKAIRDRQRRTGESYSTARMHVLATLSRARDSAPFPAMIHSPLIAQIRAVASSHPDLTYFGFRPEGGYGVGSISRTTNPAAFEKEREQLFSDNAVQQVESCLAYLALLRKTRSAKPIEGKPTLTSYGMKREVEAWLSNKGRAEGDKYIANGTFIVAAVIAKFRIYRADPRSPNCQIGVHAEDVLAVREGKDPREWMKTTAFVRWLFAQAGRADAVGDLAEDCKGDFRFPRRGNVPSIRSYLSRYGEHIIEAFEEARREYRLAR